MIAVPNFFYTHELLRLAKNMVEHCYKVEDLKKPVAIYVPVANEGAEVSRGR